MGLLLIRTLHSTAAHDWRGIWGKESFTLHETFKGQHRKFAVQISHDTGDDTSAAGPLYIPF